MAKDTDPTMGGLDALVAAASSVAGQGKKRGNRGIPMNDMIDPALQGDSSTSSDVADAMSVFLSNPAVVQLIAEYNAKKQHRHVSLYTQLLSGSNLPNNAPDTPIQQTRSGRISRPPAYQIPSNPFQQLINNQTQESITTTNIPNSSLSLSSSINPVLNNEQTQLQAIKDALENVSAVSNINNHHQHQQHHGLSDSMNTNSGSNSITDQASYDALLQAVNNDSSTNGSRFWRNNDLLNGLPNWTGLESTTLAQATDSSNSGIGIDNSSSLPSSYTQKSLGHGLPNGKPITDENAYGKRSASVLDDTGDESMESSNSKRFKGSQQVELDNNDENVEGLPEWPLPPTGKGGRKNMPREELLARRRARNRVAAQESRKKKKEYFGTMADQLKDRDDAYNQLLSHCNKLEQEVEALKRIISAAGLQLPNEMNTSGHMNQNMGSAPGPSTTANLPLTEDTPMTIDSVTPGMELPFQDLFTIDDNDADDLDFVPPSSPKRGDGDSDSDESDYEDNDEPTPLPASSTTITKSTSSTSSRKGKRKAVTKEEGEEGRMKNQKEEEEQIDTPNTQNNDNNDNENENENNEMEAEDVEEDLFLPIEDVPIPPRHSFNLDFEFDFSSITKDQEKVMKQAMNELHVDTPQQLMGVIKKMVETAGKNGGVTEEQVGMLSKLLALGQSQGMSVW